ncbi:MAG: GAF domain-containing protein [Desulfobacteraceae bacterium]|nr:GAF domain-containing protein [Desulfobacteraceae bacterium]MBC2718738.1 GAF domain-containing protein [Desulfobacteraceae bacterium]
MNLYSIPPLLTLICFAGFAVLIVLRGQKTKINILFLLICLLGSFLYIDILFAFNVKSSETALMTNRIDHLFIIYLIPLYIQFFHAYLGIQGRKWLVQISYALTFILMCFTPTSLYIESMHKYSYGFFAKAGILYPVFGLGSVFATIYVLILIYNRIHSEKNSIKKNKLKYIFAGFGIMGLMNGLNVLPTLGYPVYPPGNFSFIPLIIFAIGLFKHDLLDMGILIKKSLLYSVLTALLTCIYALIIMVANSLFKEFDFSDSMYFPILFVILIILVFGPLKTKVQELIDNIFFKGKYDYQKTIKNVSSMITSVLDIHEIAKRLMDTVVNAMLVDNCALFLRNKTNSGFINFATRGKYFNQISSISMEKSTSLVKFMKKQLQPVIKKNLIERTKEPEIEQLLSDMNMLYAKIAFPLIFENTLNGFIIIGEKLSGDLFSSEDLDLLETLASQSSLAIENAQSYKVIDDLNKNLEKKVEERTQALQEALYEKERTQEQLIQAESLAAIGQLVAGTAHELNNPLASVTSLIQSTIEDLSQWDNNSPPDEALIDDLKFADKELGRAKLIVSSLLGLSRQTQTFSEAVNINSVLNDALRVLHNQYKHLEINLVQNYAKDLPEIQGNFANLGQVAINIIQNAIQAVINNKGTINLTTRFDKDTKQVVFECRDNGPGIPESIRQDIFKPFFTTKEVGKGTGLGLYICHEIIQRHGGSITIEKSDGRGARFIVKLPVSNGERNKERGSLKME